MKRILIALAAIGTWIAACYAPAPQINAALLGLLAGMLMGLSLWPKGGGTREEKCLKMD